MSSKLKEARINAGYSIEDVSLKLNIRKQYLIDLEEENFEAIPGQIYVDGYIKLYSEFLGIDRPLIKTKDADIVKTKYKLKKASQKRLKQKYLLLASISALIVIFLLYNHIRSKNYIEPLIYQDTNDILGNISVNNQIDDNIIKNLNNIPDYENYDTKIDTDN